MKNNSQELKLKRIATILSIILPIAVALLFGVKVEGVDFSFLPPIYATINGITAVTLLLALVAIKNGKRKAHENLMKFAITLSAAFLLMYVAYHMTSDSTKYGGEGFMRTAYFFLLFSHIALSIAIVPLVLFTLIRALMGKFELHKKLARIAFPIWFYVAVSGVVVYLMISPYYGK